MENPYQDKFDTDGEEAVRDKMALGLYGERKKRFARAWLYEIEKDRPIQEIITRDEYGQRPINIIVVMANKVKPLKWIFKKLGLIEDRKLIN